MYNITVIGMGVVGSAVAEACERVRHNVNKIDKYKSEFNMSLSDDNVKNSDFIFLCLPTPTIDGRQIITEILDTLSELKKINPTGIIILKSTVLPSTTERLCEEFGLTIIHNPEFLSEKTALEDLLNQEHCYYGIPKSIGWTEDLKFQLSELTYNTFPNARRFVNKSILFMSSNETEIVKYTANCFYALKITFFNEIYKICQDYNCEYDDVVDAAVRSRGWIKKDHTNVPGRHGLGYAGMCFLKDMKAFSELSELVKQADTINEKIRSTNGN